jgi:branched-chain amino acid transport system substrate-binding protein
MFNVVGEIEPWATPVIGAGIPIFSYSSADASLLAPGTAAFTMSNPIAGVGLFPAVLSKEQGFSKAAVVVIDVPAATGPAQAFSTGSFAELDAGEVTVVPISPTAPDHGPTIQVALQDDPELVHIIGNPAFCSLSIRALRDAGFEGTISMISNCIDAPMVEQLGSDLEGIYVSYAAGEDPENPDYQRFVAIVDEFASEDIEPRGTGTGAFVALEGFRRVMEGYTGELTPEALTERIRTAGPLPQPTIEGATFQCDSTALEVIPIACTSAFTYSVLDASGSPTTFTGYSG